VNKPIIARYMLMPPSERNGDEPIAKLDTYAPLATDSMDHWAKGNSGITGCMIVSYVLIGVMTHTYK
jgi:hypothetical protein